LTQRTDQGIRSFKDTIARAEIARSEAEKSGSRFTSYWTFGKNDGVGILGAPHDEAPMQFGVKLGRLGNIRTTTLRAFAEEEIVSVVDNLG